MRILTEAKADYEKLVEYAGEELASKFQSFKDKKWISGEDADLYKWLKRPITELEDMLDTVETMKEAQLRNKELEKAGAILIHKAANDDDYNVYNIINFEASAKYGKGTKWCISGVKPNKNGLTGRDYFKKYKEDMGADINFYFYVSKNRGKYAITVATQGSRGMKEIYDSKDMRIDEIPDAPSIPEVDKYETIRYRSVYESDTWSILKCLNQGMYVNMNHKDEEDEYAFYPAYQMFLDGQQQLISIDDFADMSEDHMHLVEIYDELGIL